MSYWLLGEYADDRHPDLHESERLYGVAHTSCGRYLPRFHHAAAPEEQEARLAEPTGWTHHVAFPPSEIARQGARQYAAQRGLPDPHDQDYSTVMREPDSVRQVGRAYDALPNFDPAAAPHYDAFRNEVHDQYHHMVNNLGINVQPVDYDPYPDAHHMVNDVNNNKTLKVLGTHVTGSHPYLSDEDNDKFRAVHDFFGHAATGRSFDRHGEQAAYLAHSKMFSPAARPALHNETQGQNSSLILNGQFPPQKVAVMHPSMQKVASEDQRTHFDHLQEGDKISYHSSGRGGLTVPGDYHSKVHKIVDQGRSRHVTYETVSAPGGNYGNPGDRYTSRHLRTTRLPTHWTVTPTDDPQGHHEARTFGDEVMKRLRENPDGMTTKRDMRPAPADGYMVSDRGAEHLVPEHEMSAEHADRYLGKHPDIDKDEEAHYGLWHEPPWYYQDTSRKFKNVGPHDEDSAADQAIRNDQIAIWDNRQDRPYNTSDLVGSGSANAIGFYHGRRWYK